MQIKKFYRMLELNEPLKHQVAFHEMKARHKLFSGGVGSGKTYSLCVEALIASLKYPNNFGLIGTQTYPQLEDTTMKTFFEVTPYWLIKNYEKQRKKVTLVNGSQIIFRSFDKESKLRSLTLGFYAIDEASTVQEDIFKMLVSRIRLKHVSRRYGFLSTNPDSRYHWLYKRFYKEKLEGYDVIDSKTEDNVYLPDDYIEDLRSSYDDVYFERMVMGNWGNVEGLVYKRQPKVFGGKIDLKKYKTIIGGVDWGWEHPGAIVVVGIDSLGNADVIQEIFAREKTIDWWIEQAKATPAKIFYCDTENPEHIHNFKQGGLRATGAQKAVIDGIQEVQRRLKNKSLSVHVSCKNLLEEFHTYKWKTNTSKEQPIKEHDHALDALRYALFTHKKKGGIRAARSLY